MPHINKACFDPGPPRPHSQSVSPLPPPSRHFSKTWCCDSPFQKIYLQNLKSIFCIQVVPTKAYKSLFIPRSEEHTDEHNSSPASIWKKYAVGRENVWSILVLIYNSFKLTTFYPQIISNFLLTDGKIDFQLIGHKIPSLPSQNFSGVCCFCRNM